MRFRLNKTDDCIQLEAFLKAVGVSDDYQEIRFMIRDGKVWVNGEQEFGRRRLLKVEDVVAFADSYYVISPHREDRPPEREYIEKAEKPKDEVPQKAEFVKHSRFPLKWSEKSIKKKD